MASKLLLCLSLLFILSGIAYSASATTSFGEQQQALLIVSQIWF